MMGQTDDLIAALASVRQASPEVRAAILRDLAAEHPSVRAVAAEGGCSDSWCTIAPRVGPGTNSGCRCHLNPILAQRLIALYSDLIR